MSPIPAKKPVACPYLGTQQDPTTFFDFPAAGNCCHRLKTPARLATLQQEEYCLGGRYEQCPVFLSGSAPTGLAAGAFLAAPTPGRLGGRLLWIWIVLALVVVSGAAGLALTLRRPGATLSALTSAAPTMAAPTVTAASAVSAASTLIPSATPRPSATLVPSPTATPAATATPTPHSEPSPGPTATPRPSPIPSPTPVTRARLAEPLGLNVRRGPSLYYPIVTRLTDSTLELTVTGRDAAGRWWRVCCVTPEGAEGWVSADYITLTGPAEQVAIISEPPLPSVTTTTYVNARGGPGNAYPIVSVVPPAVSFGVIGRAVGGGWWQVCCWAGAPVWLTGDLVTLNGDANAAPVIVPSPPTP